MILNRIFRRNRQPERQLYAAIVAAARRPAPFAAWGVADTVDGRFDMIALHMYLVLDRLRGADPALGQALVDTFFTDMDHGLREMGAGDLTVGKKVRRMAEAFYGRVAAYDGGFAGGREALAAALARNVYPDGAPAGAAACLADYATAVRAALADQEVARLAQGAVLFPEPQP